MNSPTFPVYLLSWFYNLQVVVVEAGRFVEELPRLGGGKINGIVKQFAGGKTMHTDWLTYDKMRWIGGKRYLFTAQACQQNLNNSRHLIKNSQRNKSPDKVACFRRTALPGFLYSKENLKRRRVFLLNRCYTCKVEMRLQEFTSSVSCCKECLGYLVWDIFSSLHA